jgi:hypothetical protein
LNGEVKGLEGYGEGPLWRRRPALGCSADEEEVFRALFGFSL